MNYKNFLLKEKFLKINLQNITKHIIRTKFFKKNKLIPNPRSTLTIRFYYLRTT